MVKPAVYFLWMAAFCWLSACNGGSGSGSDDVPAIMRSPGFASITDSIHRFPKNAELYFRRASLLSQINQHELAFSDYQRAWAIRPDPETALQYAGNLSILGKSSEKLSLLKDCVKRYPDHLGFQRLLGEAYGESGQSKESLQLFNALLQKDSSDFETWYEKGLLLETLKDTAGAILALGKAFDLQPVNTYALELAHLYAEHKDYRALKIADEVIANDQSGLLPDPYFIKGIYYSNIKEYGLAVQQFDSCIRRDWKFSDAYIEKGIAFFKQKNFDAALNTFRMGATVSNTNPDAYYWIGRCYEVVSKKEEAILNYERAVALDKNFDEARAALKRLRN